MSDPHRPVETLRDALGDALSTGRVALVFAPPGVGKTALLVHLAVAAMDEGRPVLHVAVGDTVEHVRAHYDQLFHRWALSRQQRLMLERRRMIHSQGVAGFSVDALRAHIELLATAGAFTPGMVVVDGLDPAAVDAALPALRELAAALDVPVWLTYRQLTASIPEAVEQGRGDALQLRPADGAVRLSRWRAGVEASLGLVLGPDALLVPAHRLGARSVRLDPAEVTLYAGGARGSEAAFGELAERYGLREVNFTFPGHRAERTVNAVELSPRELEAGNVSMEDVSRRLGRTYSTEGTLIRKVLQTLWHVVSRAHQVFVVGAIQPDDTVVGGTGWSVELARMWNKDLWVYDTLRHGWYRWNGEAWEAGEPRIDALHVAGTGTRKLDARSRAALEALFARSFG